MGVERGLSSEVCLFCGKWYDVTAGDCACLVCVDCGEVFAPQERLEEAFFILSEMDVNECICSDCKTKREEREGEEQ